MYKGKVVLTIEIDMNIPEDTEDILPIEEIRENILRMDEIFQSMMDNTILHPEDGITGRAIIEEAYIDIDDTEEGEDDGEG